MMSADPARGVVADDKIDCPGVCRRTVIHLSLCVPMDLANSAPPPRWWAARQPHKPAATFGGCGRLVRCSRCGRPGVDVSTNNPTPLVLSGRTQLDW